MVASLVWSRPEETVSGASIAPDVPLDYVIYSNDRAINNGAEVVAETNMTSIPLSDLGDVVGKYVFVRARTENGTMSPFSVSKQIGVPRAPANLMITDI